MVNNTIHLLPVVSKTGTYSCAKYQPQNRGFPPINFFSGGEKFAFKA